MSTISIEDHGAVPDDPMFDNHKCIQGALNAGAAAGDFVFIPKGDWWFSGTLKLPGSRPANRSVIVFGAGPQSRLLYAGTDSFAFSIDRPDGLYDIGLKNFVLEGATIDDSEIVNGGALNLDTMAFAGSNQLCTIDSVVIRNFPLGTGLRIRGSYLLSVRSCFIADCDKGIDLGMTAIDPQIVGTWIRNCRTAGVLLDTPNTNVRARFVGCIIDGTPRQEYLGVAMLRGDAVFEDVHFEALSKVLDATDAIGTLTLRGCVFAGAFREGDTVTTEIVSIGDNVRAHISDCRTPPMAPYYIRAGLATHWSGSRVRVEAPSITDEGGALVLSSASPVLRLAPSNARHFHGFGTAALGFGDVMLIEFGNDNVTAIHDSPHVPGKLLLRHGVHWNPVAGDSLAVRRASANESSSAGAVAFVEVARRQGRGSRVVDVTTSDADVSWVVREGDHERIFTNFASNGTVSFFLPRAWEKNRGLTYTFIRIGLGEVKVVPVGPASQLRSPQWTHWIRGGARGDHMALDWLGTSVTLISVRDGYWEIVASRGPFTFHPTGP